MGIKNKRPCDWKLHGCPAWCRDLRNGAKKSVLDTNYVLEVHFWMGGKISLDQIKIPPHIELAGDCFKNLGSITNGMMRAEVEKRLATDGGLQEVSLVRFIDPASPGFKINVEFDFQRNAADQNRAVIGQDDKVIRVSKPYSERPFTD